MKKKLTEAQIKTKVKAMLKKHGVFYFMPSASIYGKSGIPDFVCCVEGLFVGIEAKSEEAGIKGLTSLQKKIRKEIIKSEGVYYVCWDEASLKETSERLLCIINCEEPPYKFRYEKTIQTPNNNI